MGSLLSVGTGHDWAIYSLHFKVTLEMKRPVGRFKRAVIQVKRRRVQKFFIPYCGRHTLRGMATPIGMILLSYHHSATRA